MDQPRKEPGSSEQGFPPGQAAGLGSVHGEPQAGQTDGNLAKGTLPAGTEETWEIEVQASSMTGLS